jgi:hypothetical protein
MSNVRRGLLLVTDRLLDRINEGNGSDELLRGFGPIFKG